ncbi:amidase [Thermosporothrix hazakensis]|jgi:amidase|uniref:Amidase n=2 Tax=Thermosporothrix TaxID=768650 RepID=A0A326UD54_THEHA|nr:amidase family protein [Thermosporothrix hazakensis]PZW34435.1 amidase [Thermosporothrix hazakensis]BBH85557.1 amidase [Thermosporothrix sp. COM3]GCE46016.1 amidase [Thermosporothrix hazakensis]
MIDPFSTATTLLQLLQQRRVSSVELLQFYLERIKRYNTKINAIVIPNEEQAYQQATAADQAYARDEKSGALQGLPLTLKDCIEVAGMRTTAGDLDKEQYVSTQTGPAAQRILDAGAVLLGKTNVPPGLSDWQANNMLFGRSNNPWDQNRTPGGSTGGGAAAVAAGLTPLEFGTDIAGSIRVPAAFCGLYGHRPSETAVPRYGRKPGIPLPNPASVFGVQGPLARSAADLQLALDVIAAPVIGEDVAWKLSLPAARQNRLADFRVAILPFVDWLPVDEHIVTALAELEERLRQQGAMVRRVQPDGFNLREYTETYITMLSVFMYAEKEQEQREHIIAQMRQSTDPFTAAKLAGIQATAGQFLALHTRREQYRALFRDFFQQWDILLTPVTIVPAFKHQGIETPPYLRTLPVNRETVPYEFLEIYPGVATLIGHPATAFPYGKTPHGLPIGLQAIGPYLEDRTAITFASLLEQAFGGFTAPPGFLD